ncbi:MAG: hypothetical protein OJF49_004253 [Ktedonobacterales bacterium]|nr:MAG: hypothetical protein OJF49_004253 [Ktedonobacterales bacterium]
MALTIEALFAGHGEEMTTGVAQRYIIDQSWASAISTGL